MLLKVAGEAEPREGGVPELIAQPRRQLRGAARIMPFRELEQGGRLVPARFPGRIVGRQLRARVQELADIRCFAVHSILFHSTPGRLAAGAPDVEVGRARM
jgi:hypothetical protein